LIGERSWRMSPPSPSKLWCSETDSRTLPYSSDVPVDDRLEQVQRPEDVGRDRLVGAMPGLADVRLRAEVEDEGLVGRLPELPHEVVDRGAVGEVREVHLQPVAQVRDVVQRAARVGADERVHVGAELDEAVRQV
jgi:hypothetical protein